MRDKDKQHFSENLFSEFKSPEPSQWHDLIRQDAGEDYLQKLNWSPPEGFEIGPVFNRETRQQLEHMAEETAPLFGTTRGAWRPVEQLTGPDPAAANRMARTAVKNDMAMLQVRSLPVPGGHEGAAHISGIQIQSLEDMESLLKGLDLEKASFLFENGMFTPATAAMFLQVIHNRRMEPSRSKGFFLFDPWAFTAAYGRMPLPDDELTDCIRQLTAPDPLRTLAADGLFYHRCGANMIQELGICLATGSEYLARAEDVGAAARAFWIRLSCGPLYFPEIARFRAARLLWQQILREYGIEKKSEIELHIHAVTSPYMMSATSPENNILRATGESMAAIMGGADSLLIQPYDAVLKPPGEDSARLARNIHHILKHETSLDRVRDPAAGSYYVEELTDRIARSAWKQFQSIEGQGGILKALRKSALRKSIRDSARKKEEAFKKGKIPMIGVNRYPAGMDDKTAPVSPQVPSRPIMTTGAGSPKREKSLMESLSRHLRKGRSLGDLAPLLLKPGKHLFTPLRPGRLGDGVHGNGDGGTETLLNKTGQRGRS